MCVLLSSLCRASSNKAISALDNVVRIAEAQICGLMLICSIFSVLFVPALILQVYRAIARATWAGEWWCPLVNIAPHSLKSWRLEPPASPDLFHTFSRALFSHLFPSLHTPTSSLTFPIPSLPSILLMVVFHSYSSAVEGVMRPYLFPPLCSVRPEDRSNVKHQVGNLVQTNK